MDGQQFGNQRLEGAGNRAVARADGVDGLSGAHCDAVLESIHGGPAFKVFGDLEEVSILDHPLEDLGLIVRHLIQVQIELDGLSEQAACAFKVDCGHGYLTFLSCCAGHAERRPGKIQS